jgi:hypothetical protein
MSLAPGAASASLDAKGMHVQIDAKGIGIFEAQP